ncbi:DUF1310 family protein [Weissella muntiaci]|nr:DUF1310 family protein [Weissella muntiaci]
MKKASVWSWVIAALIVIIGFIFLEIYMNNQEQQKMMIQIAKSDKAKVIYETKLKVMDENAFKENGIIKTYTIDIDEVGHNPMGGIDVTIWVNNDSKLYVFYTLNKDSDGKLVDDGGGFSGRLDVLLKRKIN